MYHLIMLHSNGARRAVLPLVFVLLAVVLAGAAPRGWKPSSIEGPLLLTLCSGQGSAVVAAETGQTQSEDSDPDCQPCPFCMAIAAGALPASPAHDVRIKWQALVWHAMARLEAAPYRLNGIRPPLRGPPFLA
jgi:hypothetical protein